MNTGAHRSGPWPRVMAGGSALFEPRADVPCHYYTARRGGGFDFVPYCGKEDRMAQVASWWGHVTCKACKAAWDKAVYDSFEGYVPSRPRPDGTWCCYDCGYVVGPGKREYDGYPCGCRR